MIIFLLIIFISCNLVKVIGKLDDKVVTIPSVWSYPVLPSNNDLIKNLPKPSICIYHTCLDKYNNMNNTQKIVKKYSFNDLKTSFTTESSSLFLTTPPLLSLKDALKNFIYDHQIYKMIHGVNFTHHVQATLTLSHIINTKQCAKVWGNEDKEQVCYHDITSKSIYKDYDPTKAMKLPPKNLYSRLKLNPYPEFDVISSDNDKIDSEIDMMLSIQYMPYISHMVSLKDNIVGRNIQPSMFFVKHSPTIMTDIKFKSDKKGNEDKTKKDKIFIIDARKRYVTPDMMNDPNVKLVNFTTDITHLKSKSNSKKSDKNKWFDMERMVYIHHLLESIGRTGSALITPHIHLAIPAMGLGTPVMLTGQDYFGSRHWHLKDSLMSSLIPYNVHKKFKTNLDFLLKNKFKHYHQLDRHRADLLKVILNKNPYYRDAASIFGIIPLRRFGAVSTLKDKEISNFHSMFHFILSTPIESINWRINMAIECVFYHHPNAKVIVHTHYNLQQKGFQKFRDAGYDLVETQYDFISTMKKVAKKIADDTKDNSFIPLVDSFTSESSIQGKRAGKYWYSHQTDFIRLCALYLYGGVYLDTDMYVIKPLPLTLKNTVGYEDSYGTINGAIMIFDRKASFIRTAMRYALEHYSRGTWGCVGPVLLSKLYKEPYYNKQKKEAFYPYAFQETPQCFEKEGEKLLDPRFEKTYSIHLNTKVTHNITMLKKGTVCADLMTSFCIFCDEKHYLH